MPTFADLLTTYPLYTQAQGSGMGAQAEPPTNATKRAYDRGQYVLPTGLQFSTPVGVATLPATTLIHQLFPNLFGSEPPPHQFEAGTGLSRFADPNNILNFGPHQGRGAFTELLRDQNLPLLGDVGRMIQQIAQRFMSEQDARAIQDEGSTSYGQVPNAALYAEQIASLIRSIAPERLQTVDLIKTLPAEEQVAYRQGLLQSGQTLGELDQAKQQANFLIERLMVNGLEADDAVRLQQTALLSRGEQLSELVNQFRVLADGVANQLITPEQVRALGRQYADQAQAVLDDGRDLSAEFAPRLRALSDQAQAEIPGLRDLAAQVGQAAGVVGQRGTEAYQDLRGQLPTLGEAGQRVGASADEIQALGRQVGDASSPDFLARWRRRFDPVLMVLDREMRDRHQDLLEAANARGILGSTDEAYRAALLERERADRMAQAALEAQALTEGQQLAEYSARGQLEPAARMAALDAALKRFGATAQAGQQGVESAQADVEGRLAALEAGRAPFEALLQSLQGELGRQTGALEVHAARGADTERLGDVATQGREELTTRQNIAASGTEAALQNYASRLAEMTQANQRFGATYGTALEQAGVPQSTRLQIGADVASQNLGSRLGYQAAQNRTGTERTLASRQMPFNILGAGLGAAGLGVGAFLATSDPASKTDIRRDPEDAALEGEPPLDMVRRANVYQWRYKDEPPGTEHTGTMTTELPEDVLGPDGKTIDLVSYVGELHKAIKTLDAKVSRVLGGGFRGLLTA